MGMISARIIQGEPNYSLTVLKTESLYQLIIFLDVRLKSGFNIVITSSALLYITQLSNHNMGLTEFYASTYLDWVNHNT